MTRPTTPEPIACPTCGQPVATLPFEAVCMLVTPAQAELLRQIKRRPSLPIASLVEAVYADQPTTSHAHAVKVVRVHVCRMRPRLAAVGWDLRTVGAWGEQGYVLERVA